MLFLNPFFSLSKLDASNYKPILDAFGFLDLYTFEIIDLFSCDLI